MISLFYIYDMLFMGQSRVLHARHIFKRVCLGVLYSSLRRRPPPDVCEGGAGEGQLPPSGSVSRGVGLFVFLGFFY